MDTALRLGGADKSSISAKFYRSICNQERSLKPNPIKLSAEIVDFEKNLVELQNLVKILSVKCNEKSGAVGDLVSGYLAMDSSPVEKWKTENLTENKFSSTSLKMTRGLRIFDRGAYPKLLCVRIFE